MVVAGVIWWRREDGALEDANTDTPSAGRRYLRIRPQSVRVLYVYGKRGDCVAEEKNVRAAGTREQRSRDSSSW